MTHFTRDELIAEKNKIIARLQIVKKQLGKAAYKKIKGGKSMEPIKWKSLQDERVDLNNRLRRIDQQLSEIRKTKILPTRYEHFGDIFIDTAKELLAPEVFSNLRYIAMERFKNQEQPTSAPKPTERITPRQVD